MESSEVQTAAAQALAEIVALLPADGPEDEAVRRRVAAAAAGLSADEQQRAAAAQTLAEILALLPADGPADEALRERISGSLVALREDTQL